MASSAPASGSASAQAGPSASVSDTSVAPGQTVTVRASGLNPGGISLIDYIPDGVRLATVHAGADGSYVHDVQIPPDSPDGLKQIVVTAIAADGTYAYLPTTITLKGPAATIRVSDLTLNPGQALKVSGSRFLRGTTVYGLLFPEAISLFEITPARDGTFAAEVEMPDDLLNGRHGLVVTGLDASGHFAYLQQLVSVRGGIGDLPGESDPFAGAAALATSTTTTSTTSTTERERARSQQLGNGSDSSLIGLVVMLIAIVLLIVLAVTWYRSPAGKTWRRHREEHRRRRHHA
jgi:hypothetical protein